MRGLFWIFMGVAALATSISHVGAQDQSEDDGDSGELPPAFSSDRPGFANTTQVAARGRATTELGVTGAFGDDSVGALPNLSLRVGLLPWLEARMRGPNGVGDFGQAGPRFGLSDPSLGVKAGGRLADGLLIATDFEVSLPIGTAGFGAPEATYFADVIIDWNFWGPLTLTPNAVASVLVEVDSETGETVRFFEGGFSLKFTWQIIDVLYAFVQSYALKSERSRWRVQVGGGLGWMVAPNVQLDVSFDAAVTEEGDLPTVGLGTTILW